MFPNIIKIVDLLVMGNTMNFKYDTKLIINYTIIANIDYKYDYFLTYHV